MIRGYHHFRKHPYRFPVVPLDSEDPIWVFSAKVRLAALDALQAVAGVGNDGSILRNIGTTGYTMGAAQNLARNFTYT